MRCSHLKKILKPLHFLVILAFFLPSFATAIDTEKMKSEIDSLLKGKTFKFDRVYTIKIGTLAPEHTPWTDIARNYIIPTILNVSNGNVKVILYSGGTMGDDPDVVRKMRIGQLQGCGCTATGLYLAAPELSVFSLPFLFSDYDEVNHVLTRLKPEIEVILEKKNLMLFALIHTGFMYLFSKEEVKTIEDMRKKKVLTWFGRIEQATLDFLNIKPIPLSVPEVVMGLRSGLITAHFSPPVWSLSTQAYLSTPYMLEPAFFYAPAAVIVDRNSIKEIPQEAIKLTREVMEVTEKYWAEAVVEYERKCLNAFKEGGIKFIRMDEKELKGLKKKIEELWFNLADTVYPRSFLEKIIKTKEEYRPAPK